MELSTSVDQSKYSYCIVGVNHRSVPVAQREMLTKIESSNQRFLPELALSIDVREAAVLSTCNRFEVIAVAEQKDALTSIPGKIIQYLRAQIGEDLKPEHFYQFKDSEAIRHLFRVSSSMDSLVLGEAQILGQVKDSYQKARDFGLAHKHLHHLFQFAFRVAKRIRSSTEIGIGAVSVGYVAVRLAEQILGDLKTRSVLVLGSGQMAEITVLHLKARGCSQITVANRTLEKAAEIAAQIGASAINLADIERVITESDVVIGSLSIDRPIIETQRIKKLLGKKPQFFIDLGVPRNFSESIGKLDDVYLYTIDDLSKITDQHKSIREDSQHDAEIMIEYGLLQFDRWLKKLAREPLLLDLRSQIENICQGEITAVLGDIDNSAEISSRLTRNLTNKISHRIIELIKNAPESSALDPEVVSLFIEDLLKQSE